MIGFTRDIRTWGGRSDGIARGVLYRGFNELPLVVMTTLGDIER